ncbi:trimeric intracellular cation channel family protein [Persephonella sp. KM09-Lau-8]|uniref:trimeric intracellular cation channel family protein n=1 Tax=Persephonella sp. KM09-Lau-8 TaxID=1158345 RepID=UPI000496B7D0|nr:trimeric intracellular cation channel family protein [Persephonella sp. KM09-Lau-8]
MNMIGLVAFAVMGSFKALREGLDLFGITVLGVLTALGGGITRDLLVNKIPNALTSYSDFAFALIGVWLAIVLYRIFQKDISNRYFILIPDAIGLSAFTTTGAMIAYNADVSFFGIVILATLTGIGGGIISDILLGKIPVVLKDDFYASCAIIGAVAFYISVKSGLGLNSSAVICSLSVLMIRVLAILYKWKLPRFS